MRFKIVWNSWNAFDYNEKESNPVNLRSYKMKVISDYFVILFFLARVIFRTVYVDINVLNSFVTWAHDIGASNALWLVI